MAQWNPFEDLATLRQEIDRAFEGFGEQDPLRLQIAKIIRPPASNRI
jgi:hypothetical protein